MKSFFGNRKFLFIACAIAVFISTVLKPVLLVRGCDGPGHLLLSQTLIDFPQQTGNAEVRDRLGNHLLSLGFTQNEVSDDLGPHCTHWVAGYAYNQYPPFIPAIIKPFPFPLRAFGFGVYVFLIYVLVGIYIGGLQHPSRFLFAFAPVVVQFLFRQHLKEIHGMVPCFGLLMCLMFEVLRSDPRPVLIGAFASVLITMRYDTVVPLLVVATMYLFQRPGFLSIAKAAGTFGVLGVLPLMLYQRSTTGSLWKPTTPWFDLELVGGVGEWFANFYNQVSIHHLKYVAFVVLALWASRTPRYAQARKIWLVGIIFGIIYIFSKKVIMIYYAWPWASLAYGFFLLSLPEQAGKKWYSSSSFAIALLAFIYSVAAIIDARRQVATWNRFQALRATIPSHSKVWIKADYWSGVLDSLRIYWKLGPDFFIVDDAHSSPEVQKEIHSWLFQNGYEIYQFRSDSMDFVRIEK